MPRNPISGRFEKKVDFSHRPPYNLPVDIATDAPQSPRSDLNRKSVPDQGWGYLIPQIIVYGAVLGWVLIKLF